MEKRKWYNNDYNIETSLLGFGAMRLKTVDGEIDEEKGFKLFDLAYENGVNYFDTALPYTRGKNETFVGKALKRYPRESFYLASKFSMFCFKTKEEMLKTIDIQLQALQTDYIDFYLVHAFDKKRFEMFKELGLLDVLKEWKAQGKIRHIGFSFHDSLEVFKEILDYYNWEFVQIQLNYIDKDIQQGIEGYYELEKRNIPVIVMEPVKGGRLADFNSDVSKLFKEHSDASLASYALRWVGTLPGVKVILSGMNDEEQVLDNLKTFNNFKRMDKDELELVDKVANEIKKITRVGCTKCRYCLPCPKGVNIPRAFSIYNDYAMYKNEKFTKDDFNDLVHEKASPYECIKCGLCATKCPQRIDIPHEFDNMFNELSFLKR